MNLVLFLLPSHQLPINNKQRVKPQHTLELITSKLKNLHNIQRHDFCYWWLFRDLWTISGQDITSQLTCVLVFDPILYYYFYQQAYEYLHQMGNSFGPCTVSISILFQFLWKHNFCESYYHSILSPDKTTERQTEILPTCGRSLLNDSFKTLFWKSNQFSLTNFLRRAFKGKLIARLPNVLNTTASGSGAIC